MTPAQRFAISLLRKELFGDELDISLTTPDSNFWDELHSFAKTQGVSALIFKNIPSDAKIPKSLKVKWALETDNAIRKYRYFENTAPKFEDFFKNLDLIPVHFKGLALSLLYPHPELRECGDFDFYLYDKGKPSLSQDIRENALRGELLAEKTGMNVNAIYPKHGSFDFEGVHVECHRFLVNLMNIEAAKPVEDFLYKHLSPLKATITSGKQIHIANQEFTKTFVGHHALQHCGTGMRLRHIVDWTLTARKYGNEFSDESLPDYLKRGCDSLSAIANIIFDVGIKTSDDTYLTSRILYAILNAHKFERLDIATEFLGDYPGRLLKCIRRHYLSRAIFPGQSGLLKHIYSTLRLKIKLKYQ